MSRPRTLFFALAVACSAPATQPTVVIRTPGVTCDDATSSQDPYEAVLARARCDRPDMVVNAASYVVRRVPSAANVQRFSVDHTPTNRSICCYEVDANGVVTVH